MTGIMGEFLCTWVRRKLTLWLPVDTDWRIFVTSLLRMTLGTA